MTAPKRGARSVPYGKALTERETQVLHLVGRGLSTLAIADKIGTTESSARSSIRQIMDKLGTSTRAHAVAVAYDKGLIAARRPKPAAPEPKPAPAPTPIPDGLICEVLAILRAVALGRHSPTLSRQAGIALQSLRAYTKPPTVPAQRTRDSRP